MAQGQIGCGGGGCGARDAQASTSDPFPWLAPPPVVPPPPMRRGPLAERHRFPTRLLLDGALVACVFYLVLVAE
jgi:hypothetical protein